MRSVSLLLLAMGATAGSALPAQDASAPSFAMALDANYLPLESVRDGVVRMPKALGRRVTVHRRDALLQQVLLDIATQAGLGLSYGEEVAEARTIVSLDFTHGTAAEALALAVRGTQWAVLVNAAGQVAVIPADRQQLGSVEGRVTDRESGGPIAGATVAIEGTRLGSTTNDDGRYRIQRVPPGSFTVAVRRIGYERASRDIAIVADEVTTADFALNASAATLGQMIVTGVPVAVPRRAIGNDVGTLDVEEMMKKVNNVSVTELLQAKVTGVSVLPGGGSPGTGSSIRIRGAGSLYAGTAPVIYLDGVRLYTGPQGNFWNSWRSQRGNEPAVGAGQDAMALDMLKPEDIESLEIIKGPAASTLYGAEAANGVIQIITKKGTRGEQPLQWTAKAEAGASSWAVDRVTNYTTCTPATIASRFSDGTVRFPGCQGAVPGTMLSSTSLDLPGALRSGALRNYTLTVRGGGPRHSFFVAGDLDKEEGVFFNSANQRSSARANFALYPQDNLDFTINFGFAHSHTQFPINDDGYGLIQAAMLYRPGISTDTTGNRRDGFEGGNGPERVYEWDNRVRANRMTLGSTVNFRPFSWLTNRLTMGIDQTTRQADKYLPPGSLWSSTGQAERGAPGNTLYTVDYAGTITNRLMSELTSALSFGAQYNANHFRNTVAVGNNFPFSAVRLVTDASSTVGRVGVTDQKSLGLYVQEMVGWKDRRYLTAAVRVDNNSVFGDEIRLLYYPKLSASWVISEEPFFHIGALDQLRLRAAWGQAGNAPPPFAGQRSYVSVTTIDDAGNRVPAARPNASGNEQIKPERGTEIELGFDATLMGGRADLQLTYYNKVTNGTMMQVADAASTGFTSFRYENLGKITNRGLEVSLTGTPLTMSGLQWDSRLSFSTNRNRLESFGIDISQIVLSLYQPVQRHQPGYPLGGYWANFPQRDASGNLVRTPTGGLVAADQVFVGPATPTREASLANTFSFREDLRLFVLFDYKGGHYLYNVKDQYRCYGVPFANTWSNNAAQNIPGQCWEVNDPGRAAESKEVLQQDPSINNGLFIQKADFIKFRDVSLTYNLPSRWISRFGTDRASVTVAGHNLGFLWKPDYTGPDPEVNFTGVDDPGGVFSYIRVDSWTAPMTRRFTAALEVGF